MANVFTSPKTGGRVIDSKDLQQEYLEKELNRRQVLQGALAIAATTAACGASSPAGSPVTRADAGSTADAGAAPADVPMAPADVPPAPPPTHLIGVGYDDDHVRAIELAVEQTVGFSRIQRGQRVYLKVNTNSGDPFPYSTSPDAIRWVVGRLRDLGAEVFIGDRSFWGDRNTRANFERNGIADIATELGVELVVFGDTARLASGNAADAAGVDWMDLPASSDAETIATRSRFWTGTMRIPARVATADHIINMPCVKTHFLATFTMSMKNIIGIINPVDRSQPNNLGSHSSNRGGRLYPQIAFMNKVLPTVSLNILDGWNALISGGPTPTDRPPNAPSGWRPQTAEPKVVIASPDRIAADLTGAALLRTLSPMYELIHEGASLWDNNRQMSVAVRAGVGITDRAQYDIAGPSYPELERIRTLATA
jgi:uncharacterized protein (DUF362 family)